MGGGIRRLSISSDSLKLYYLINWSSPRKPPTKFDITNVNKGYKITLNGIKSISTDKLKLPNSTYKIIHDSNGDAGSNSIYIKISNQNIIPIKK